METHRLVKQRGEGVVLAQRISVDRISHAKEEVRASSDPPRPNSWHPGELAEAPRGGTKRRTQRPVRRANPVNETCSACSALYTGFAQDYFLETSRSSDIIRHCGPWCVVEE